MNKINFMVEEHIGYAKKLASNWRDKTGLEYDDLFQIASMGLHKAAKHYKEEKGFSFSTWAYKHIENDLNSYCQRQMKKINTISMDNDEAFLQIEDTTIDIQEAVENSEAVKAIKESITDEEFKLLWMRAVEGMSQKEIAKVIGKSQAQVHRIEHKIKEALYVKLADYR